jgi:hypothetical protein
MLMEGAKRNNLNPYNVTIGNNVNPYYGWIGMALHLLIAFYRV